MKKVHVRSGLLCILVFIMGLSLAGVTLYQENKNLTKQRQVKTQLEIKTATDYYKKDLERAIYNTEVIEANIIANKGKTTDFNSIAGYLLGKSKTLMSLQLAPQGIVKTIYPQKGNEKGKLNLFEDPIRSPSAIYSRDHHITSIQGPFPLKQGGRGLAVRNPIYINKQFWGFSIAIVNANIIFQKTAKRLESLDYNYILTKSEVNSAAYTTIASNKGAMKNSVIEVFSLGGSIWRIEASAKYQSPKELRWIGALGFALSLLISCMLYIILRYLETQKKLYNLANTDYLTKLYNRQGFDHFCQQYLEKYPQKECVGVLMDVDDFKYVNDLYGHEVGDALLRYMADTLRQCFKEHAIIGRNGGDEFSLLITSPKDQAVALIHQFFTSSFAFEYRGEHYTYNISLGYAIYPSHAKDLAELLRKADVALYDVKLRGKHGLAAYSNDLVKQGRSQLGFNLKDLAKNLPGAFFIYQQEDGHILFANEELLRLFECRTYEEFLDYVGKNVQGMIVKEERYEIMNQVAKQITPEKNEGYSRVSYHIQTKITHRKIYTHAIGHMVQSENFGRISYVIIGPKKR